MGGGGGGRHPKKPGWMEERKKKDRLSQLVLGFNVPLTAQDPVKTRGKRTAIGRKKERKKERKKKRKQYGGRKENVWMNGRIEQINERQNARKNSPHILNRVYSKDCDNKPGIVTSFRSISACSTVAAALLL